MKFGQDFQAALQREEYPQDWIESALSYKKLKKCIKRVQQELLSLGLDQETLNVLWQHVGAELGDGNATEGSERLLHYRVEGNKKVKFTPKLTIAIDPRDGSPMDAWLSPDTRRVLRRLARNSKASVMTAEDDVPTTNGEMKGRNGDAKADMNGNIVHPENDSTSDGTEAVDSDQTSTVETEKLETIEIPLTSDSEFFRILRRELADLDKLHEKEQRQLQSQILQLGGDLRKLKAAKGKKAKEQLEAWQNIFQNYTEAQIFLSSHEQDAGSRDASHAVIQFQNFNKKLSAQRKGPATSLNKEAAAALDRFMTINLNLLRLMKFQEINRTALTKIIKKFDKQTALHARSNIFTSLLEGPLMSQDLARAASFTISEELLTIIPQLDDYLCPVCFSISWKPVRLRCNHVFCIRCLIVMQAAKQDHCPLCRGNVVTEANEGNIDKALMKFLDANFHREVKDKQKANEIAAGIDRWGAQYENSQKCKVM